MLIVQRRTAVMAAVLAGTGLGLWAIATLRRDDAPAPPARHAQDTIAGGQERPGEAALDRAARGVIAFLRGAAAFDEAAFADTVRLYMNPDGDVIARTLTRQELRIPADWTLRWGRGTYGFVPPATHTEMTTLAGRHFRCFESELAERVPALRGRAYVGVKLEPPGADSCLQTWNVTLVFDDDRERPRLVAAVYDQWEW